jgi:HPt (histidine-containing phosphotransfer) domain-containing protein
LESRCFEQLGRLAHQLKGSGGGYGFPIISEVASKLETKIKSTASPSELELSSIQKSVDDLINILELARESLSQSPA